MMLTPRTYRGIKYNINGRCSLRSQKTPAMEFVALSDTALRTLALEDPELRRVFHGVYLADQLP